MMKKIAHQSGPLNLLRDLGHFFKHNGKLLNGLNQGSDTIRSVIF